MLTWPPAVRVFVSLAPTDMRRSFDGLACLTRDVIQADPLSGHLFVFFNRQRDRTRPAKCIAYVRSDWHGVCFGDLAGRVR